MTLAPRRIDLAITRLRSLAWGDELVDSLGGWRISLDVTPHDPITAIVTYGGVLETMKRKERTRP
jgi:hypothetical protein